MAQAPHEVALSKAKIQLMSRPDSAFFTTLCFNLVHVFDESIPTASTNGKEIRYNPEFFLGLTADTRVSLLVHETMHVAYLHMLRLGDRDHRKFNIAADHVINLQMKERGFPIPDNWMCDDKYKGLTSEEVYKLLPDEPPTEFHPDLIEAIGDLTSIENEIQDMVIQASIQSKASGDKAGTIPGEIEIFLNKLLNPKLPWHTILRKYMNSMAKTDYSFRKPNRRFFPEHHLPSMHGSALNHLAFAVDTSGSVSDQDFLRIVSEIHGILKSLKPEKMTIIQFDTDIRHVNVVGTTEELKNLKFTGRGGTCIGPVMDWVAENRPQLTLVFSDGYFGFPKSNPNTKCAFTWLVHNNPDFKAPFGKVIHYEM